MNYLHSKKQAVKGREMSAEKFIYLLNVKVVDAKVLLLRPCVFCIFLYMIFNSCFCLLSILVFIE